MKHIFLVSIILALSSCKEQVRTRLPSTDSASGSGSGLKIYELQGETMGTYYKLKYTGAKKEAKLKEDVAFVLKEVNNALSTYIETSLISRFNQRRVSGPFDLSDFKSLHQRYFKENLRIARDVYNYSDGYYDPTVMPLVNYWGFGYAKKERVQKVDSQQIAQILASIGMDKLSVEDEQVIKKVGEVSLDFSSIAKGYGVDQIAILLDTRGIKNYYIEIGGECRASGNKLGKPWQIGIAYPDTTKRKTDIITKLPLVNMSVATSGNYRNYYKMGEQFVGHTINPKTGYPEVNRLLSATVFYPNCATADALATACMAMGYEKAFVMIDEIPEAECYLVWTNTMGKVQQSMTKGVADLLE